MDYKVSIAKLIKLGENSEGEIEALLAFPKDSAMGDYALPCFKFAKEAKKSPQAIAEALAASIKKPEFLSEITAVAGYLNFRIDRKYLAKVVFQSIEKEGANYGGSNAGKGKTICIDYSSINIAKPFHIGHLSTTVIGAALYRTYEFLGYKVVGINHLGDWGTQFGKLIVAYKLWGNKAEIDKGGVRSLYKIYVKYHQEAESNKSLDNEARAWFKKIEDGDKEAMALFYWFKEITLKEVTKLYDRLNVKFDSFDGESFFNDKMAPVLDELLKKKLLEESEGAKVVKFLGEGNEEIMPPCLLVKADGATLYATRDIAAAFYRKKTYDFYKCLYVVAYQQNLHFKQFFKVIEMMGYDWDLVHIPFGMVSIEEGSMSTRSGNVVFLEDVINKAVEKALAVIDEKNPQLAGKREIAESVGIGAVVFGVLQNNRIKDICFSYDKMLNFDGETAPYVQYTYARCTSVLAKLGKIGNESNYEAIMNNEGSEIVRLLQRFPEIVRDAAEKYEPSFITRYAVDLSQMYNKFYYEHRINVEDEGVRNTRAKLTASVRQVIENAMRLIGIKCPSSM